MSESIKEHIKNLEAYQSKVNLLEKDVEKQKKVIAKSSENRQRLVEEAALDPKVPSVAFSKRHLGAVQQERKEIDTLALQAESLKRLFWRLEMKYWLS